MTARNARNAELLSLRTRIARTRRRLDRDIDRSLETALLKRDWRAYIEQHPARSLALAAGVGAVVAGIAGRDSAGGERLVRTALGAAWPQIWRELSQLVMPRSAAADADSVDAADLDEFNGDVQ